MGAGGSNPYKTTAQGQVEPTDHGYKNSDRSIGVSRQGAQITMDQYLYWALQGRLFHTQQGDAGTRVAWTETVYDEDQPQFAINVPTGKTIIPLSMEITVEIQAGTFSHFIWSTMNVAIGAGTSTPLTITSMRTDAPHASGVTANSLYTGNGATPGGLIEVKRWVDPFVLAAAGTPRTLSWDARKESVIPVLVGPATLQMHTHATTSDAEGYVEVVWAEFDTPALVDKA